MDKNNRKIIKDQELELIKLIIIENVHVDCFLECSHNCY